MDRMVIEISDTPEIKIASIHGSLRLKGWDRPQVRVDMELEDTLEMNSDGNTVKISCQSGCLLRVPNDSTIEINSISNDLVIKSINGPISVKQVNGQISVKSIGSFNAIDAHGNFNAKHIEGNLQCERISGNASVQDVDGDVVLKTVHGNLTFSGPSANLEANAYGKVTLELEPELEGIYNISTKGSINYRVQPFTNATISMVTKGGKIRLNLPDNKEAITSETHEFVIGEGDSKVALEAAGNIEISGSKGTHFESEFVFDDFSDFSSLADDISQIVTVQIEDQMESISQHISDLTNNLSNIDIQTSEKNRRKLESERRNLERKLANIERKVQHKARGAERRIEHKMRYRRRKTASDPVSDEERQMVLEMLQAQQIDVAEAEVLLAALEGRAPKPPSDAEKPVKTDDTAAKTES